MGKYRHILFTFFLFFLAACDSNHMVVSQLDEREANEIVVFLASKGVTSYKVIAASTEMAGTAAVEMHNIVVPADRATDAMAILNRYGLPRRRGTNLLELFAKSGLMSSDREETIRYQAGLAEQLKNTVRKIDGVIDADVQISFPPTDATLLPGQPVPKTTAAIYVKHQGILEDPNAHIETKIKRLISSSVNGLNFEDVAVISDRSRFADVVLTPEGEPVNAQGLNQPYVQLWSMILSENSVGRFRFIFFSLITAIFALVGGIVYLLFKLYPQFFPFKKSP